MELESEGTTTPSDPEDNLHETKSKHQTRLFDSFDWDSLSTSEKSGLDFSYFINSPSSQAQVTARSKPGSPSLESPASQIYEYKDLLSPPDFSTPHPQIERPLQVTDSVETHGIAEFLAFAPKSRASRKRGNNLVNDGSLLPPSSRRLKTFQSRLEAFRPYLTYLVSSSEGWGGVRVLPSIGSICSSSINQEGGENEEAQFAWDHMQGVGFQEIVEPIVLIGYVLKIAPPSTHRLGELCRNIGVLPLKPAVENKCCLFLEDATAKIRLELGCQSWEREEKLFYNQIVSGVPIAAKGFSSEGRFWVDEVLFATPPPPVVPLACINNEVDMVFVSSLSVGKPYTDWSALDSLFDYLQGLSGSQSEHERLMIRKTRVFFLGNSFPKRKRWNPDRREELISQNCDIADKLDYYFAGLASTTEVFLVPGEHDPTHQMTLPQPPLHKRLFPNAMEYNSFRCLTNPAQVCLRMSSNHQSSEQEENNDLNDNVINLVVSSGANVKETMGEMERVGEMKTCCKLMEWSHLHPTSTDDGGFAEDLFSLSTLPHLFVVGGQSKFRIKEWNGVKVVSIPPWDNKQQIVVVHKNGIAPLAFKIPIR